MDYARFALMIVVATALIFCVSYLNVDQIDDLWFSLGRVWMAIAAGAAVAVVIILFLPGTFVSGAANSVIIAAALAAFAASAWLVRSGDGMRDVGFMRGMIPHHAAAVLAAERAHLRDPRVRALADGILASQTREIAEMRKLIAELQKNRPPANAPELPPKTPQDRTAER